MGKISRFSGKPGARRIHLPKFNKIFDLVSIGK